MKHLKYIALSIGCLCGAFAQTSCDIIDDDLSDCGKDYTLIYRIVLDDNVDEELDHVLDAPADAAARELLRTTLRNGIFANQGRDLDASFYLTTADEARRHHAQVQMGGQQQAQYTFYLPAEPYRHLAVANVGQEPLVKLTQDTLRSTARLLQLQADTIDSQSAGYFSARKNIEEPRQDTTVYVDLYMVNSAVALVVDTTGYDIRSMHVVVQDMATQFGVNDSLYTFTQSPVIRTRELQPSADGKKACFMSVCLPSANTPTRAGMPDDTGEGSYWQMRAYVTLQDGSVTENVLYIRQPLPAGRLKVIKAMMEPHGVIESTTNEVSVAVQFDWQPGGSYNPTF
ncbi:MAG: hypothetical protein IJV45_00070 [Prevotella sp.]|nr:hypothetical protein [Prevotella sp.]